MSTLKNRFDSGRALLIGIGQGYPGRLKLPAVVRADAEGLASVLTRQDLCGYPKENVQLLLDEDATRDAILEGLRNLAASVTPNDTVIIFFSGHGGLLPGGEGLKSFLCPVDYDSEDPEVTGIEAGQLSTLINGIHAARVVVILDACHSDGAVHLKGYGNEMKLPFGFRAPTLEKLASGAGRVVISSCREDETSITHSAKGHSLFTYFLLEGLRGCAPGDERKDGLVKVFDLFDYVSLQVPVNAVRGHVQHPVIKMHAQDNFPLALRKGGWFKAADTRSSTPEPAGYLAQTRPSIEPPRLERLLIDLFPSGPQHDEIWSRAGGDIAALGMATNGRAGWHAALRMLSRGGGGADITFESLIQVALDEYPKNPELLDIVEHLRHHQR